MLYRVTAKTVCTQFEILFEALTLWQKHNNRLQGILYNEMSLDAKIVTGVRGYTGNYYLVTLTFC